MSNGRARFGPLAPSMDNDLQQNGDQFPNGFFGSLNPLPSKLARATTFTSVDKKQRPPNVRFRGNATVEDSENISPLSHADCYGNGQSEDVPFVLMAPPPVGHFRFGRQRNKEEYGQQNGNSQVHGATVLEGSQTSYALKNGSDATIHSALGQKDFAPSVATHNSTLQARLSDLLPPPLPNADPAVEPFSPAYYSKGKRAWIIEIRALKNKIEKIKIPLSQQEFEAKLTWVEKVNSMWFWLAQPGRLDELTCVMKEFSHLVQDYKTSEPLKPLREAKDRTVVLAPYGDCYYRAVVVGKYPDNDAMVFFPDYGNRQKLSCGVLLAVPDEMAEALAFPMVATRCKPVDIDFGYQFKTSKSQEDVSNTLAEVMEKSRFSGAVLNVSTHLCEVNVSMVPLYCDLSKFLLAHGTNLAKKHLPHRTGLENNGMLVRIAVVSSASEIFCLVDSSNTTKFHLSGVEKDLYDYMSRCPAEVTVPQVGDLVCVALNGGNRAGRGRVVEYSGSDGMVSLVLLDYGSTRVFKVSHDRVRSLRRKDLDMPPWALRCIIDGIASESRSAEHTKRIDALASEILKVKHDYWMHFLDYSVGEGKGDEYARVSITIMENGKERDYRDVLLERMDIKQQK
ncbi:uncharacterized protein LOC129583930 [Paramacrobiotus metropolitanus]|uniref:uncharacterized protein LOC129583930 n=1 Tax=Paramacrobiotus metropolitanus TaxID=2943436 RepID=UPI0024465D46|nr:uncharacterized protein LOC129583930 [Paramacrobiotus metropolitanus]